MNECIDLFNVKMWIMWINRQRAIECKLFKIYNLFYLNKIAVARLTLYIMQNFDLIRRNHNHVMQQQIMKTPIVLEIGHTRGHTCDWWYKIHCFSTKYEVRLIANFIFSIVFSIYINAKQHLKIYSLKLKLLICAVSFRTYLFGFLVLLNFSNK